jgi:hypothetical protein
MYSVELLNCFKAGFLPWKNPACFKGVICMNETNKCPLLKLGSLILVKDFERDDWLPRFFIKWCGHNPGVIVVSEATQEAFIRGESFNTIYYRFWKLPDPIVPYGLADASFLIGKAVRNKESKKVYLIIEVDAISLAFCNASVLFSTLLSDFEFLDGSPCGKES